MMEDSAPLLTDEIPLQPPTPPDQLRHPYVAIFHIAFRSMAILTYTLCEWFNDSFVTNFVFVVLLLSADFWTVKNITGRILVGLRWWNYIDDNGNSHWIYESRKDNSQINVLPSESLVFWSALIFAPIIWSLLFVVSLFRFNFEWLLLVSIALSLNAANLFGYLKCKFGKSAGLGNTIKSATSNFFRKQLIKNMTSAMNSTPENQTSNQPTQTYNI